jgi:hypothetical protein
MCRRTSPSVSVGPRRTFGPSCSHAIQIKSPLLASFVAPCDYGGLTSEPAIKRTRHKVWQRVRGHLVGSA